MEMHNSINTLSIRFRPDGFSLSFTDDQNNTITSRFVECKPFELSAAALTDIFRNQNETGNTTSPIKVICEIRPYIFIPDDLFMPEHAITYLEFAGEKKTENNRTLFNQLNIWKTNNVFVIPESLHQAILQFAGNIPVQHHLTELIHTYALETVINDVMHIYCNNDHIDAIVIKSGKPVLINSYKASTPEDIAYYALLFMQETGMNADTCKINVLNNSNVENISSVLKKHTTDCIEISVKN